MTKRSATWVLAVLLCFLSAESSAVDTSPAPQEIAQITYATEAFYESPWGVDGHSVTFYPDRWEVWVLDYHPLGGQVVTARRGEIVATDLGVILAALNESDFYEMPSHLETGAMGGHTTSITVVLKDGRAFRVAGEMAELYGPLSFQRICLAMEEILEDVALEEVEIPPDPWLPLVDFLMAESCGPWDRLARETPSSVAVQYNSIASGKLKTTEDAQETLVVLEALRAITVGPAEGAAHTDDFLTYIVTFADGVSAFVEFQGGRLVSGDMTLYAVEGLDALEALLQPDSLW